MKTEFRIKGTFIEGQIIGFTTVEQDIAMLRTENGIVYIPFKELTELTTSKAKEMAKQLSMKFFRSKKADKVIWYILFTIGGYLLSFLFR